jgi:hypothetical protein
MGEALGHSLTLCFCVAVSIPFILSLVLDKVAASHYFKVIDRQWTDKSMETGFRFPPFVYSCPLTYTRSGILGLVLVNSLLCQLDLAFG